MRLRLDRFDGLRLYLTPGWYELPSHLEASERVRLQGILAAATGCREILECEWCEMAALRGADLHTSLIHVSIPPPPLFPDEARSEALREYTPRLGLFTVMADARWPERAWDELDVKSALATWLRQSLRSPSHPLVDLGIAALPINALIAATTEPIELLELLEATFELSTQERAQTKTTDWQRCVKWSLSRRLAARLHRATLAVRPALARAIAAGADGPLPALLEPRVRDELARLGLAHVNAGDVVLVPLARIAAETKVAALLELEGVHEPSPMSKALPPRLRARDPQEAAQAFDPLISISSDDPWFVDLPGLAPRIQTFTDRLRRWVLRGRGTHARIAVLQRPHSGANTMLRRILFEAQRVGLVTVTSRLAAIDRNGSFYLADLLLAALRSLLTWSEEAAAVTFEPELLAKLRIRLATIALQGEEHAYFTRVAGIAEHIHEASLIALIRRAAEADRPPEISERLLGATYELLDHVCAAVQSIQDALAGRGLELCLRFEGLDAMDDLSRIDAIVLARGSVFHKIPCHIIIGLHPIAEFSPEGSLRASEVFATLVFPEAPSAEERGNEEARAITWALLGARAKLDSIFGEHEVNARLGEIAAACGGEPYDTLMLARLACEYAQSQVTASDVERARRTLLELVASSVPDGHWQDIEAPTVERIFALTPILERNLLVARDGNGWAPRSILQTDPRLLAARLRRTGTEAAAVNDLPRAEADLRASVEILSRVHGTVQKERALSLNALASLLFDQGRLNEAENTFSLAFATIAAQLHAYVRTLLRTVENLEIVGISSQPGRSRDAVICSIEQLYTPLTSRAADGARAPNGRAGHSARVLLSEILPEHPRLLIVGQPGSGKTTFARMVACMLARDLLGPAREPTWRKEFLGLSPRQPAPIPGFVRMAALVGLFEKHSSPGPDGRTWLLYLLAVQSCPQRSQVTEVQDPDHLAHCEAWDELLRAGKVLLLLDGLDEIADPALRRRVLRVLQDACQAWPSSAIVATSRPIGLETLTDLGFHTATIDPFGPDEVTRFINQWSTAMFAGETERSAGHEELLLAAIRERPEIRRLATNPVMLTCLCVIHWNEGRLPEGRALVYRAIFRWMLAARSDARRRAGYTDAFAENAFASLALAMVRTPEGKQSSFKLGDAAAAIDEEMQRDFAGLTPAIRHQKACEWLLHECQWSHITEEIAGQRLRFWHLTLQEFLAALALAWREDGEGPEDWWPVVKDHLDDPQWRETVEMLPGCLFDEGGRRRVDRLIDRVLYIEAPDLAIEALIVGIIGRLLAPMSAYEYMLKPQHAASYEAMRGRVMAIFTVAGAARVPLKIRITAADALGRAGDPRLAQDNFLEIPGMNIAMGRFPVTVAEFEHFVADEGYAEQRWWDPEGWAWRAETSRQCPRDWDEQRVFPNRPVNGLAWFDARAYCRWLAARSGAKYSEVRMPYLAEWERAASPDGRTYPWGEASPTEATANFRTGVGEATPVGRHPEGVGAATPVGLYPEGMGPAGHLDLAGNVFEWCEDGPPDQAGQRWIKGGNWYTTNLAWMEATFREANWISYDFGAFGFRVVVVAARSPLRA